MAITFGTESGETLTGSAGDDEIYGLGGNDTLDGGDGNDLLDGGSGWDIMTGGAGNDVYIVDDQADQVIEAADGGVDEVRTSLASYTLAANVENGFSSALVRHSLSGNGGDNILQGGDGDGVVSGYDGDDTILYSAGADTIRGGTGYDLFVLPGSFADYLLQRDGAISVRAAGDPAGPASVLELVEAVYFAGDGTTIVLAGYFDRHGTSGDDSLEGDGSDNLIYGYEGNDILAGHGGDDEIDGGAGADTMIGGAGNDLFYVDDADTLVEEAGGGYDTAVATGSFIDLGNAHIEEVLTEYSGDMTMLGSNSANRIFGDAGNDWLEGRGGNDYLDGYTGADTMIGGTGNDTYVVDDVGDAVIEAAGAGIDTVEVYLADYTIPANVENVQTMWHESALRYLTGNALGNIFYLMQGGFVVDGGGGGDTVFIAAAGQGATLDLVTGEATGDAAGYVLTSIENLTGTPQADVLRGTAGANILDGRGGADTLVGRGGNDIYYVDDTADTVIELDGEGSDEVRASAAAYALPDHVEKLKFVGSGAFAGTGNALNNDITGGTGADTLDGGDGHDTLSGGGGNDILIGGAGHDTLSGGAGADSMAGGDGNDAYIVDNTADSVVEAAGEGTDQVYASSSSYTLPDHVENLSYNGYGGFAGTGNGLDNILWGGGGADTLAGGAGNDELRGSGGDDLLYGEDGDDLLVGGSGVDFLSGGAGADQFRFTSYESGTGAGADTIADFLSGADIIDLSQIDADSGTAGDQAFAYIGAAAFSGIAGELRYAADGADTRLQMDIDGDAVADFEILLVGALAPLATDFLL